MSRSPFSGTETYYAEYRPGYGARAIQHLRERFPLDDAARVLDLGCGTGQIALPLAEHVDEVVGMDPNEAMLDQAARAADRAGLSNVEWRQGSDATLGVDMGPVHLTTMGRSFHWMDQERTLDRLWEMTVPGGGVALLNDAEWFTRGTREWQDEVYEAAAAYVDDLPDRTGPTEYEEPWDELLADFGYADVGRYEASSPREWTVDEILGYVFSLSFCSPATFGEGQSAFESEVRELLDDERSYTQTARVTIISGKRPDT